MDPEDLEVQQLLLLLLPPPLLLQLLLHGKQEVVQVDLEVVLEIHLVWDMGVALEDLVVEVHTSNIISSKVGINLHHYSISNKDLLHPEVALMVAVVVAIVLHNISNNNTIAHPLQEAEVLQHLYLMGVDQARQIVNMEEVVDHLMGVVEELRCHLDHLLQ